MILYQLFTKISYHEITSTVYIKKFLQKSRFLIVNGNITIIIKVEIIRHASVWGRVRGSWPIFSNLIKNFTIENNWWIWYHHIGYSLVSSQSFYGRKDVLFFPLWSAHPFLLRTALWLTLPSSYESLWSYVSLSSF